MRFIRIFKYFIISLLFLIIMAIVFVFFIPWDVDTVSDDGLTPQPYVIISNEDNAAELFVLNERQQETLDNAIAVITDHTTSTDVYETIRPFDGLSEDEIRRRTVVANDEIPSDLFDSDTEIQRLVTRGETRVEYDVSWLGDVVPSTEEIAQLFFAASERSRHLCMTEFDVELYGEFGLPDCAGNNVRDIARVMVARAVYFDDVGQQVTARNHVEAVMRVGTLLLDNVDRRGIIDVLIGTNIINTALDVLDEELSITINRERYSIKQSVLSEVLYSEHDFIARTALSDDSRFFNRSTSYFFQPNQTRNSFAQLTRLNEQLALTPCGQKASQEVVEEAMSMLDREITLTKMLSQNSVGKLVVSTLGSTGVVQRENFCELHARLGSLE